MHTTNLRKVGGSVMLEVPAALLDILHLQAGSTVGVSIDGGRLIVEPSTCRVRDTFTELMAQCDATAEPNADDRAWLEAKPVGTELM
jgi:antitoxin ChpS